MTWRIVPLAAAAFSVLVIVASAFLALRDDAASPAALAPSVLIEPDEAAADPTADGVIVLRSSNLLFRFTPEGTELARTQENTFRPATSVSGRWQAFRHCLGNTPCQLLFWDATLPGEGRTPHPVELAAGLRDAAWSPVAEVLAALDDDGGIMLVEPSTRSVTTLGAGATAFAWTSDGGLVFATLDAATDTPVLWVARDGRVRGIYKVASVLTGFVPSPDGRRLAFAQDDALGWQLLTVDGAGVVQLVANAGRLLSSPPEQRAPGSLAISWSPDGSRIAFSPVAWPFVMHIALSDGSGEPLTYYLREGYAGEMKWSPDGSQMVLSTYSLDRKEHNLYLLESLSSEELRFLGDGCLVFWSPGGRFVVAKREPHDLGVGAIRVDDGYSWPVTPLKMTPASWGTDEATALKLAEGPPRGIGGLGK
jgi:hypothetical protein